MISFIRKIENSLNTIMFDPFSIYTAAKLLAYKDFYNQLTICNCDITTNITHHPFLHITVGNLHYSVFTFLCS